MLTGDEGGGGDWGVGGGRSGVQEQVTYCREEVGIFMARHDIYQD